MYIKTVSISFYKQSFDISVIVYAFEHVHELGKIEKIESNRIRDTITCIITMAYWSNNCTVLDLQGHLLTHNVYRLHVNDQNYLLIANTAFFNITYRPIQHMDLLLVVDKDVNIREIGEFMNKINIGKISHYKEVTIKNNDLSNNCVVYDLQKMKAKNQEKKCIHIIFNHWFNTDLGHTIHKNIQQGQYCKFPNQWKFYFEPPYFIQNNPYNYTARTFLCE